jgi:chromosome partitioning protein
MSNRGLKEEAEDMRVIAISNQKGGSAKSTTAINLAAGLARAVNNGKRILLVDMDPQAAATAVFLGVPFALGPQERPVVREVLMGETPAEEAIQAVQLDGLGGLPAATLDVLPAHLNLAAAEMELITVFERERKLRQALEPLKERYAFVVVDCPPSLGLLTVNALMAAGEVLIPVDPGFFPLIGLGLLRQTIEMVRQANPALHVVGVLPVKLDRTILAQDTARTLRQEFGALMLSPIPSRVSIGEAHAQGKDILSYAPASDGAQAYGKLILEVLRRG